MYPCYPQHRSLANVGRVRDLHQACVRWQTEPDTSELPEQYAPPMPMKLSNSKIASPHTRDFDWRYHRVIVLNRSSMRCLGYADCRDWRIKPETHGIPLENSTAQDGILRASPGRRNDRAVSQSPGADREVNLRTIGDGFAEARPDSENC